MADGGTRPRLGGCELQKEMDTTREELDEDFLTCLICTEIYTDPCTLTCGHSFCKSCLTQYMKTQLEAIENRTILCPYCRQVMPVDNSDGQVSDWIQEIEPSLVTKRLLESFGAIGGTPADGISRTCFTCQQVDHTVQAVNFCHDCDMPLCSACTKMHAAVPVTSRHSISDLSGMLPVVRRRVVCKEHNIVVDFYCKDCNESTCHKCCIIHHRKCDTVLATESMVPEMKRFLCNMRDRMAEKVTEIKTNGARQKSVMKDVDSHSLYVVDRIQNARDKAIVVVKNKAKLLIDEIGGITNKQTGTLKAEMKIGEIDMQMYQQYCEFITKSLASDSTVDICEMYRMCKSGTVGIRDNDAQEFTWKQLWFGENEGYCETIDDNELGSFIADAFDADCTFVQKEVIDIRKKGDKRRPELGSITAMQVDGMLVLVVVDKENKCLTSVHTRDDQTSYGTLRLRGKPVSVGQVTEEKLVVCLTSNKQIVFVKMTPDSMVTMSTIGTKRKYDSLTVVNASTLAVGRHESPIVDILDMSTGSVRHSIKPTGELDGVLQSPAFLASTPDANVLVSDIWSNSVYCVTQEGDVVFTFPADDDDDDDNGILVEPRGIACTPCTPDDDDDDDNGILVEPRGIACTPSGHILVADWGSNRVVQLTALGDFNKEIQLELENPCGLCVHGDRFYITEKTGTVKVFGLN